MRRTIKRTFLLVCDAVFAWQVPYYPVSINCEKHWQASGSFESRESQKVTRLLAYTQLYIAGARARAGAGTAPAATETGGRW